MHESFSSNNRRSKRLADRLVSEANAQKRNLTRKVASRFDRDPPLRSELQGPGEMIKWVGAFSSISWTVILSFRCTSQLNVRVDLAEALDQVESEGIVVIN